MNKLILFGLLALLLNSINGDYSCNQWSDNDVFGKKEDLDGEDCAMLSPEFGKTHCCLYEEGDTKKCFSFTDDEYENMGRVVKYIEDKNQTDVDIDCSSKFLSLSLFAICALLF